MFCIHYDLVVRIHHQVYVFCEIITNSTIIDFLTLSSAHFCVLFPKATRGFQPVGYRGELLSTFLHAIVYIVTQFAECTSTYCKLKNT
jgi:hypothetical protein